MYQHSFFFASNSIFDMKNVPIIIMVGEHGLVLSSTSFRSINNSQHEKCSTLFFFFFFFFVCH